MLLVPDHLGLGTTVVVVGVWGFKHLSALGMLCRNAEMPFQSLDSEINA